MTLVNSLLERYFRNRIIEKIFLVIPKDILDTKQSVVASTVDLQLASGKVVLDVPIEELSLHERLSKDPASGITRKIKWTLLEMYMNEFYEALSKNVVMVSGRKPFPNLFMFYNKRARIS